MPRPLPPAFLTLPLAHRALHDRAAGRPENSRAAIAAAIAAGYGIEIDVQLTADDRAAVFHDYDLNRLTPASGPVRKRSAAELSTIPLTGGDEGIPMLDEVLALVAGRVPLLVEIKDQDGALGPNVGPLEDAVLEAVAGYEGPLAAMSYNPHSTGRITSARDAPPAGLVTCAFTADDCPLVPAALRDRLRPIPDFDSSGASFVSHDVDDLSSPWVAALKRRAVPVLCWTVRSPEMEARARRVADNITFEGYAAPLPGA